MLSYTWRSPQCDTQGRRFRGTGCIYWNTVGLTSAGPLKLLTLLCSLICHCRSLPLRANCSSLIQRGFFHWLEQGCHVPAHFWQPPSENCSLGQLWPWVTAPEQAAPGCGLLNQVPNLILLTIASTTQVRFLLQRFQLLGFYHIIWNSA